MLGITPEMIRKKGMIGNPKPKKPTQSDEKPTQSDEEFLKNCKVYWGLQPETNVSEDIKDVNKKDRCVVC